jgi:hypothetical protein
MASTLLLDRSSWDLVLDASGDIAVATEPYSLAQDAASALRTFLGECYYDTTLGVPYLTQILGQRPSLSRIKQLLVAAAQTVPGVASAEVFLTALTARSLSGQVQVVPSSGGPPQAASFTVTDPQGV